MTTTATQPLTGPALLDYRIKLGLIRLRYRRNQVDPNADTPARVALRSAYEKRKARHLSQGLTSKGKPRSTSPRSTRTREERQSIKRTQHLASYVRRREKFFAQGLNASGLPRRREWTRPLVQST